MIRRSKSQITSASRSGLQRQCKSGESPGHKSARVMDAFRQQFAACMVIQLVKWAGDCDG
jgi:hypothetical protein